MNNQFVAVDLGGTQIRAARFDHRLNMLQRENTLTLADEGLGPTLDRLKRYIDKVLPHDRGGVEGIGFSSPGPLNPMSGVIIAPPNLPGWRDVPLADIIRAEFGLPVHIGNDANAAALAEACKGAAQGHRHVVYITVSTGIGAGMICDGRLLLGRAGLAAEFGHIPILLEDGRVSSVELEAAGPAIARRAKHALREGHHSLLPELVGGDISRIDAKVVSEAARNGDALAISAFAHAGRILGLGIVALLHLFNPEVIVIGGGVAKAGDFLFTEMHRTIREHALDDAYLEALKIETAALGDDVALVGAAALVATAGGQIDVSELDRMF